jgi:hypothetical protein
MKPHKLRLIAIACAALACLWCATSRSPLPSPLSAIAEPSPQITPVSAQTTQACQSVVYQMVTIQQLVMDEKQSRTIRPLAPMDELVAQEYRINTSKCPTDFRLAVMRFVMAEDSARVHAHMDRTGNADEALVASMETVATHGLSAIKSLRSLNDYNEKIADEQKRDLANIQSALLDFAQVAMKYGVK